MSVYRAEMDIAYFQEDNSSVSGNHGYLELYPGSAIPYLTIITLASVCGTLGNILAICAVLVEKELRSVGNLFIINLAAADLCVTAFVDPFSIVGVIQGERWFSIRPGLCDFIACICLTSCFCSLLTIGTISVNRYIHICHWKWYNKIFTLRKTVLMCVGLWIVSFMAEMPNFLGWGDHVYDQKTLSCVWDRTVDLSYSIFFSTFGVAIPLAIIAIIYAKIYWYLWKRKATIELVSAAAQMVGRNSHDIGEHAWMVFVCFIVFTFCWLPYAIVVVLDYKDVYPREVHLYAILIAHTNSSLNSIVYGVSNKSFRHAYLRLLGLQRFTFQSVPRDNKSTPVPTAKAESTIMNTSYEPMVTVDTRNMNI